CRLYLSKFGKIMHHNVDKALLVGGSTSPEYKGGKVVRPMEIIIAGRATMEKNGKSLPVEQVAEEAIKRYLSKTIINLNIENSVKLNIKI
ncbi:MAG: S-adenosylmethionine synthase, partial [Candidatus Dadabacteria bacterium]|nr:S-adenosylmethionine synthase [Candidatus Dadabacteria bacterium]